MIWRVFNLFLNNTVWLINTILQDHGEEWNQSSILPIFHSQIRAFKSLILPSQIRAFKSLILLSQIWAFKSLILLSQIWAFKSLILPSQIWAFKSQILLSQIRGIKSLILNNQIQCIKYYDLRKVFGRFTSVLIELWIGDSRFKQVSTKEIVELVQWPLYN